MAGLTLVVPGKRWGILDTDDNVWMGNDDGPVTFDDFMIARVAAQTIDVQLGNRPGRCQAREYEGGPKRLRDQVDAKMSFTAALEAVEEGRVM